LALSAVSVAAVAMVGLVVVVGIGNSHNPVIGFLGAASSCFPYGSRIKAPVLWKVTM